MRREGEIEAYFRGGEKQKDDGKGQRERGGKGGRDGGRDEEWRRSR